MQIQLSWCCFLIVMVLQLPIVRSRDITNEDIKDAILSLANMVRNTEDKLERHEMRERQLGEIIKKNLNGLHRRHQTLEPISGMLSRLDERLAGVETILMQRDEKEKVHLQKTLDSIDGIKKSLETWMSSIPSPTKENPVADTIKTIDNTIGDLKKIFTEKTDSLEKSLKSVDSKANKTLNLIEDKIKMNGELLEKYETKLDEHNKVILTDIITLDDQKDWHKKYLTTIDKQSTQLEQISKGVKDITNKFDDLANKNSIVEVRNKTLDALQELKYELKINMNQTAVSLDSKLSEVSSTLTAHQEETIKSITELSVMSENVHSGVTKSYEQLRAEVQSLAKVEKVMIQTADNVLDAKRRIEYGVHQILLEVGDLVKLQGKELNSTINKRFNEIETTFLDHQTGSLNNLTTKIELEMSQVWRQIGIMYQQLTASNTALDRLQAQTNSYINGSLSTMDSMEGKVGQITKRMTEVDENLNYLLGRLGLVTQEFNAIKSGLGDALDNIRSSFTIVQNRIKSQGPGPHNITEGDNETTSV